jgi:hypothetical protein
MYGTAQMEFDSQTMTRVADQSSARLAMVHAAAGHKVEDHGRSVTCETCGRTFVVSLYNDRLFGWILSLAVEGRGRPFTTNSTEDIKAIVYGTHPEYGVGTGREPKATAYLRALAYVGEAQAAIELADGDGQIVRELAEMGERIRIAMLDASKAEVHKRLAVAA